MIWQLLQVKHVENIPLIFAGKMWPELIAWMKTYMLDPRLALINPEDLKIPHCVDTADEAIVILKQEHQRWLQQQTD